MIQYPRDVSYTLRLHQGLGAMLMNPGVLLMMSLLSLYLFAMVIFWHCFEAQTTEASIETKEALALKAGQTIIGVEDTARGIDFYIDASVREERYSDF